MGTININENKAKDIVEEDLQYIVKTLAGDLEDLKGKKILITGGAGFLGYYLVQSLLHYNMHHKDAKDIEITVYDNYMRGLPGWLKKLENNDNLHLVDHDITNPLPKEMGHFEYIVHAASVASPTYYRQYPLETMDANVNGLRFLLNYALEQKQKGTPVKGFLFFSTSEIYGDPDAGNIPTPETYRGNVSCTGPRACYDESKRYGETLCVTFAKEYDIPVTIARPFNNYGPGLKITDRRVIPDFMKDVLAGRNIKMYSDGSPSRTFCYIADAIAGYFKILLNGKPGESYNIGVSEPEISMKELAEMIVSIAKNNMNYGGKVEYVPSNDVDYLVDNPNRRCPIIHKAQTELGYNPSIKLEEGLIRNFFWYMDNNKAIKG